MKNKLVNAKIISKFNNRVDKSLSDCWIWTGGIGSPGYGIFYIDGKNYAAHVISYRIYKGNIPKDKIICHTCDNRACVNPEHLWLGTYKENMQDCIAKGRFKPIAKRRMFGETNPQCILKESDIETIKRLRDNGLALQKIADKYGVCRETIRKIIIGKTWNNHSKIVIEDKFSKVTFKKVE